MLIKSPNHGIAKSSPNFIKHICSQLEIFKALTVRQVLFFHLKKYLFSISSISKHKYQYLWLGGYISQWQGLASLTIFKHGGLSQFVGFSKIEVCPQKMYLRRSIYHLSYCKTQQTSQIAKLDHCQTSTPPQALDCCPIG